MRPVTAIILILAITGCAQKTVIDEEGNTELSPQLAELPQCNASAWQLDGLLWFDSSIPVDNKPAQQVFDSAGRKCLMLFN